MLKRLSRTILMVAAVWAVLLMPSFAIAQDATLTCSGGSPSGQLIDTGGTGGYCSFTDFRHVFSNVVCEFVKLIDEVLSKVYCGFQQDLVPLLGAIFTIYIAVFGFQLAMGMTELTMKEGIVRLLKLAFVYIFAVNATWGVAKIFGFFVALSANGVSWVMDGINAASGGGCTAGGVCPAPNPDCVDSSISTATGIMIPLTKIDEQLCNAVAGPLTEDKTKVIGFFLALSAIMPPVFLLGLQWLWMNFWIMVQGAKTFLFGIMALGFLISMSPIFLSFVLFKATYQFFETWLRYMISFSLQIILIFACIALWIIVTLNFVNFFTDLSNIIVPMQGPLAGSAAQDVVNSWGFCDGYSITDTSNGPKLNAVSCSPDATLPVTSLLESDSSDNHMKLISYIVYHLLTLIILSYAFKALINQAPMIAVYLAGPEYVPVLGQGFGLSRTGSFRTFNNESGVLERSKMKAEGQMSGSGNYSSMLRDTIGTRSTPSDT